MGSASLMQMPGGVADRLKRLVQGANVATDIDRQQITAFLEQKDSQDYVPASGQIVGILKSMKDEMEGELAVSVVQVAGDIDDTEDELADGQKFLAGLMKACPVQEKLFAEHEQTRAAEVSAISDAIGVLNDDDALDVFKKAAPSALLQESAAGVRRYGFLQRQQEM